MGGKRLSSRIFLSFAVFSLCMLGFIALFTWMSYEAGREAATQKLLGTAVQEWQANPGAPLPQGTLLYGVLGEENLPVHIQNALPQFEEEDYDVSLWEWEEIQLWQGLHPDTGQRVFFILELGQTADEAIFTPNLERGLFLGGTAILATALLLSYFISQRLSKPLRELSRSISSVNPHQEMNSLEEQFPDGETGEVARAFDGLQLRLQRFADRERRFTRDASHELRTPLTLMRTATQVLRNSLSEPTPKQTRALDHLNQGVEEMTHSVDSFLYLARERELQPGDGEEEPARILTALVEAQQEGGSFSAPKLHVRIEGEPRLAVPVELFRIVAGNILRNAIQHGKHSPIHIHLSNDALTITDQGPGIPENVRATLGKPFPPGRNPSGVGLGLSIIQEVADRAGWTVRWEAPDTGGTNVTVRFT